MSEAKRDIRVKGEREDGREREREREREIERERASGIGIKHPTSLGRLMVIFSV